MKLRTCKNKHCGIKFQPERDFQTTCGYPCAIEYAKQLKDKREKADKKEINKAKREFNASDRSKLTQDAQKAFNAYIRTRDGKKCISCGFEPYSNNKGDLVERQFHAGHFKSQGGNSALRFDENNVHAQCSICNNHLSGNLIKYKENLIQKIGIEEVTRLETAKEPKRFTIEELKEIKTTYTAKRKELEEMQFFGGATASTDSRSTATDVVVA